MPELGLAEAVPPVLAAAVTVGLATKVASTIAFAAPNWKVVGLAFVEAIDPPPASITIQDMKA